MNWIHVFTRQSFLKQKKNKQKNKQNKQQQQQKRSQSMFFRALLIPCVTLYYAKRKSASVWKLSFNSSVRGATYSAFVVIFFFSVLFLHPAAMYIADLPFERLPCK